MHFADHFDFASFQGLGREPVALAIVLATGATGYSFSMSNVLADNVRARNSFTVTPAFPGAPGSAAAGLPSTAAASPLLATPRTLSTSHRAARLGSTRIADTAIDDLAVISPGHQSTSARQLLVNPTTRPKAASSYVIRYELPEPIVETNAIVQAQDSLALAAPLANRPALERALGPSERQLAISGRHANSVTLGESAFAAIETTAPLAAPGLNAVEIAKSVVSEPGLVPPVGGTSISKTKSSAKPGNRIGLIDSGQDVDGFDLASLAKPAPIREERSATPRDLNRRFAKPSDKPAWPSSLSAKSQPRDMVIGGYIAHQTRIALNGAETGSLAVQVGMNGTLSIKLSDLLKIVQPGMVPTEFQRLTNSSAATELVSFAKLRAAGIGVRYDAAHDMLKLSTND